MMRLVCSYFLYQRRSVVPCGEKSAQGQQFHAETLVVNELVDRCLTLGDDICGWRCYCQRLGKFLPAEGGAGAAQVLIKGGWPIDMQVNVLGTLGMNEFIPFVGQILPISIEAREIFLRYV